MSSEFVTIKRLHLPFLPFISLSLTKTRLVCSIAQTQESEQEREFAKCKQFVDFRQRRACTSHYVDIVTSTKFRIFGVIHEFEIHEKNTNLTNMEKLR